MKVQHRPTNWHHNCKNHHIYFNINIFNVFQGVFLLSPQVWLLSVICLWWTFHLCITYWTFTRTSLQVKIAEHSKTPEDFLKKYEELKSKNTRNLDPLVYLLSKLTEDKEVCLKKGWYDREFNHITCIWAVLPWLPWTQVLFVDNHFRICRLFPDSKISAAKCKGEIWDVG